MDFITTLVAQLHTASATELPRLRTDYEAYLANLNVDERAEIIRQVEPVLGELMAQSINRLELAAAAYSARSKGASALSAQS